MDILEVFQQVFDEYEKYPCSEMKSSLEKMFIKTMLFKIGFFNPASEVDEIKKIRNYLNEKCPNWYKHTGFKSYYTKPKQIYNQLLVRFELYGVLGWYKELKRKAITLVIVSQENTID